MENNLVLLTKKLLGLLKIKSTKEYIEDAILSHADYPSLLSVSDTLHKYEIENLAIKVDDEKLYEMPLPCIVQVSIKQNLLFFILTDCDLDTVSYYDQTNKLHTGLTKDFLKIWTGICLVVETNEKSKEPNIEQKIYKRKILNNLIVFTIISLILWAISEGLIFQTAENWFFLAYYIFKIIGLGLATLLLLFEIDSSNPRLQSFCSGGKKVNCNLVLSSKYANLFKGYISLSSIGFAYFSSSFLFLLFNSFSISALSTISWLSFLSLPAILISFYFQAIVIREWCKFCLGIQLVLISEIIISYLGSFYVADISLAYTPMLLTLFLTPIMVWLLLKPLLVMEKEVNFYKRDYKRIKNNIKIFESLLLKSRKIQTSTQGLGITLNQNNAKYKVIKVCNPYCGPCASAHPILEKLYHQKKIGLQILFTATSDIDDRRGKPVRHFLALDEKNMDQAIIQKALEDWYLAEKKDYEVFAKKYPVNKELTKQKNKLDAMRDWCNNEKIIHTPTIFINGYELPKEYSVKDLLDLF